METIQAYLVRVRTRVANSTWKVCEMRYKERTNLFGSDHFIAVGEDIPDADSSEVLELIGEWQDHDRFGPQFKVDDAGRVVPEDTEGMEKYLAAEIKGIGPKKAKLMVDHFGLQIRDVLENNISRLKEIGFSEDQIFKIREGWDKDRHLRPIQIFLAEHGINGKTWAKRIFEEYGLDSVGLLQQNPYRLTKISGLGFRTADEMARKMKWPETSPQRTEAACMYVLDEARDSGHVFLYREELACKVADVAGFEVTHDGQSYSEKLSDGEVQAAIDAIIDRHEVVHEFVMEEGLQRSTIYLPWLHYFESCLATQINRLLAVPPKPSKDVPALIAEAEKALQINLSDKQKKAVIAALLNSFSIITGGPGTGKSTVTSTILYCMKKLGWQVGLAAPTGRAAKRISEVTGDEASTVHRLLGYNKGKWEANEDCPLGCDALFVDEWSMGDTELTYRVMMAVPDGCHVVVIGDVDQLPSVGPGMVLRDLIDCGRVPVTRLDTIFRQAQGSLIVQNAHYINHGRYPVFPAKGVEADNYVMYVPRIKKVVDGKEKETDDIDWIYDRLDQLASYIPEKYGIDPKASIQVLAPKKKGSCGTFELNKVLQRSLNPDGTEFFVKGMPYRVGDRVMQMKNNYDLGVFNGDIGIIVGHDDDLEAVQIDWDGNGEAAHYPYEYLKDIQLAFASTVHKVQGSEIPIVIIVLLTQHYAMLERTLVYTALTRAKKMCLFITTQKALSMAVNRSNVEKRNSRLGQRIRDFRKPAAVAMPPAQAVQLSA